LEQVEIALYYWQSSEGRKQLLAKPTLRLDRRRLGRVDVSDVIQEASMSALRELPNYLIFVRSNV
jgi:hypothetical protein